MISVMLLVASAQIPPTAPAGKLVDQPAACPAREADLPPALAAWQRDGERLEQTGAVVLRTTDNREPGDPPGRTATIAFSVPMRGEYAIAVDQDADVEIQPVMENAPGRPIPQTGEDDGPDCSSISRLVRFNLNPGTYYSLGLTGLSGDMVRVMLVPPRPPGTPDR